VSSAYPVVSVNHQMLWLAATARQERSGGSCRSVALGLTNYQVQARTRGLESRANPAIRPLSRSTLILDSRVAPQAQPIVVR
jgi:hypothetical protein